MKNCRCAVCGQRKSANEMRFHDWCLDCYDDDHVAESIVKHYDKLIEVSLEAVNHA